jgi:hypothetical protein
MLWPDNADPADTEYPASSLIGFCGGEGRNCAGGKLAYAIAASEVGEICWRNFGASQEDLQGPTVDPLHPPYRSDLGIWLGS